MNATFFPTEDEFREWLEKNHKTATELLVGFYKVGSSKMSMTWSQSVDQALCFGWIDGIRKSIDKESYSIRFTLRRKNSIWSEVNIKKVEELTIKSLMTPEGLLAFSFRKEHKSGVYSHENDLAEFDKNYENKFKQNKLAWSFFEKQAPSYKRVIKHWVMTAKQEKTRSSRLERVIKQSEQQRKMR
jgi:uncharacterized protein YdeI (YjbR/CyaY-like superfamily)